MNFILVTFCVLLINLKNIQGQNSNLNVRLIGDIRPSSAPQNAAIFFDSRGGNICSGALIHPLWVLTTATCARKAYDEEMRVMFGGNVVIDFDNASHIKNIHLHPSFFPWTLENDIALVELLEPTSQTNRILKIGWASNGMKGYVLGYGNTNLKETDGNLRQHKVNILDNKICEMYPVNINYNKLCTYEARACEGDQGGPLISEINKTLIGLISINEDQAAMCGGNQIIPVTTYTHVGVYRYWIRETTNIKYL